VVARKIPPPSALLEKLGLMTKTRPGLVIGGASAGSVVLVLFLVGASQLIGHRSLKVTQHFVAPQPVLTARAASDRASVQSGWANTVPIEVSPDDSKVRGNGGAPGAPVGSASDAIPDAIAAKPDVTAAVGHVFSGRLAEAEQAYRELSTRFPDDPAFRAAARILARRNGPACRAAKNTKTSCPTVKQ